VVEFKKDITIGDQETKPLLLGKCSRHNIIGAFSQGLRGSFGLSNSRTLFRATCPWNNILRGSWS